MVAYVDPGTFGGICGIDRRMLTCWSWRMIATVGDVMKLKGMRTALVVKRGLSVLKHNTKILWSCKPDGEKYTDPEHKRPFIGFVLAPV